MYTTSMREFQRRRRTKKVRNSSIIGVCIVLAVGIVVFVLTQRHTEAPAIQAPKTTEKTDKQPPKTEPATPLPDVQPVIDAWAAQQPATYGIVVYDVQHQKVIGAHNADEAYFTASLYKPYVAYLSLQRLQDGRFSDTPNYLGEKSRKDCIYAMIHSSDSPCGEKMMAELGRDTIDREIAALGTTHTSISNLVTSAGDMTTLFARLATHKDLNDEHTAFLLDAMTTQIFRNGLPKGFTQARVADKVGFNEQDNYHDAGIVTFGDNQQFIVSILSQRPGSSRPLAALAGELQTSLLKQLSAE